MFISLIFHGVLFEEHTPFFLNFTILLFQGFLTKFYPSRLFEFIKDHLFHCSIKNFMMQNVSKENLNVDT